MKEYEFTNDYLETIKYEVKGTKLFIGDDIYKIIRGTNTSVICVKLGEKCQ